MSNATEEVADKVSSSLTLRKSFFDDLWPLILEKNPCETHSKNTSEFFEPTRQFDKIWGHTLLAENCFQDYQKPLELDCRAECYELIGPKSDKDSDAADFQLSAKPLSTKIADWDQQRKVLQMEQEQRQKLAFDFVNRKYPWYIQRPIFEKSFVFEEARGQFTSPFELKILHNIQSFECKLMIIDAGANVGLLEVRRWINFCRYAQLLVVVRCTLLKRQLRYFGNAIHSILIQENMEETWQEELTTALNEGTKHAKEMKLLGTCAKAFVFVFSNRRGMETCNTFKILRSM